MAIDSISATSAVAASQPAATVDQSVTQGLGQEAFLQLLLAELQNQDPLKPMEDRDFIAQLAQFEQLSQITQMNKALSEMNTVNPISQGSVLLGQMVSGYAETGEAVTGLVTGFYVNDKSITLEVDGYQVPYDTITSVQAPTDSDSQPEDEQG